MSEAQPRIKGAGIRPFLVWYASRHGAARLLAAASAIPSEHRAGLDLEDPCLGVLASSWYPASSIHALLDNLVAGMPADQHQELAREGARAIIDSTLKGVYRLLFQTMMTPERYARNAQALFARFYDTGTMVKTPLAPVGHLSRVRDWSSHHPMLCQFIGHTAEYVYAALGCRDVRVRRTACVGLGDEECRFEITWTP